MFVLLTWVHNGSEFHGGLFMASTVANSTRVWNARITDSASVVGPLGDIEHLRCLLGLVWILSKVEVFFSQISRYLPLTDVVNCGPHWTRQGFASAGYRLVVRYRCGLWWWCITLAVVNAVGVLNSKYSCSCWLRAWFFFLLETNVSFSWCCAGNHTGGRGVGLDDRRYSAWVAAAAGGHCA